MMIITSTVMQKRLRVITVSRVMMCKGDVLVDVHSADDYEESEEYVVDSIVAQKGRGRNLQYMVKWKVSSCTALDL